MKKLIYTIGLLTACLISYGQERKTSFLKKSNSYIGTYFLGGHSTNLGIIGSSGFRYNYMMKDKLAIGFDTRLTTNGERYREITFGPSLRYYASDQRIKPFIETRYSFGQSQLNTSSTEGNSKISKNVSNGYLGTGLLIMNKTNKLGVELSVGREFDFTAPSNSRFIGGIGLNIKL